MEIDILRIDKEGKENLKDIVTEETPLTIYLDKKELLTLLCTPCDLRELNIGMLYSTGLVRSMSDIENIVIDGQNRASYISLKNKDIASELAFKRMYTSGCGRGVYFYNALDKMHKKALNSNLKLAAGRILELMKSFEKCSLTFKQTGGVHSAALSDGSDILTFKEDIGRHNALDKVIGEALIKGLNMQEMIVLTSGRISSEIVFKVQKMLSPFLISRSAPTDQAVGLAREFNLTLVGFVRGGRMNVYAGGERIE